MKDYKLKLLRDKIYLCDRRIIKALEDRLELVERISKHKAKYGLPVIDPSREKEILLQIASCTSAPNRPFVENVFKAIVTESALFQEDEIKGNYSSYIQGTP